MVHPHPNVPITDPPPKPGATSTASTCNSPASQVTLDDMIRAMDSAKRLADQRETAEWMLIGPDGRVWKGKPADLLGVLAAYHPLLSSVPFHPPLSKTIGGGV
jgi:hypothetical protein